VFTELVNPARNQTYFLKFCDDHVSLAVCLGVHRIYYCEPEFCATLEDLIRETAVWCDTLGRVSR